MPAVTIDAAKCDRSPACPARRVCPKGAIVPIDPAARPGSSAYTVIEDICAGCGICAARCPGGAVAIVS